MTNSWIDRRATEWNGRALYAVKLRWRDDSSWKEFQTVARITPKLVTTSVRVFNRTTGRDRTAHSIHTKPSRLVAYKLNESEDWTRVSQEPAK